MAPGSTEASAGTGGSSGSAGSVMRIGVVPPALDFPPADAATSWQDEMRAILDEVITHKFEEVGLMPGLQSMALTASDQVALESGNPRTLMRSWTARRCIADTLTTPRGQSKEAGGRSSSPHRETVAEQHHNKRGSFGRQTSAGSARGSAFGRQTSAGSAYGGGQGGLQLPGLVNNNGFNSDVLEAKAPPTPKTMVPAPPHGPAGRPPHLVVARSSVSSVARGELQAELPSAAVAGGEPPAPSASAVSGAWGHSASRASTSNFDSVGPMQQATTMSSNPGRELPESSPSMRFVMHRLERRTLMQALPAKFEGAGYVQLFCAHLILNPRFDYFVSFLILANAATMGASANHGAHYLLDTEPLTITSLEKIFCTVFTVELTLRLLALRGSFFCGPGNGWNIFDLCIVSLQLFEEILAALAFGSLGGITGIVRLLRLVRVIRLARILRLIRELRVLVTSITNSMKSLMWTLLLMFLIIYSVSLCITQLVTEHRVNIANQGLLVMDAESLSRNHDLEHYFGSLWRSMLSLFQAVSGGIDWDTLIEPLIREVHPALAFVFVLYVAVTTLAIMNVVTGVFVDSVLASAKADKEQYLLNSARQLFQTVEEEMDWDAFQAKMSNPQMLEFFKGIDVDPSEAKGIFSLIDADESGSINADEFLNGCVRLHGPSKALETAVLLHEVRSLRKHVTNLEHKF